MSTDQRILVFIATYNEKENLEPLLVEVHKQLPQADVLIVDDNSPDGTGQIADQLAANDSRVDVIHRPGKLGLGTAITTGMRYAGDRKYDLFINMDADFSHHPRHLPALVEGMKSHDIMIGSRYVRGGGTRNWPLMRVLISKTVNKMCRFLMRLPVRDCSGGLRCFRVANLRQAKLEQLYSSGYSFHEEVLFRCWKSGCRIGEVPIIFENRKHGKTKANLREMVHSLSILIYVGLGARLGRSL